MTDSEQTERRPAGNPPEEMHGDLVSRGVHELLHHPSYTRHALTVPASTLSRLAERNSLRISSPLTITRDNIVIDGYGRWAIARKEGRISVPCLSYDLSEKQALQWLIQAHRESNTFNTFSRILLALDLEPVFKKEALANQRAGGRDKGRSNLTEAETRDVRELVAKAAGVSVGNVSKVKQLLQSAHPTVIEALRRSRFRFIAHGC